MIKFLNWEKLLMQNFSSGTKFITLSEGRKIAYCEYGDLNGAPVFYFHGTPGSRLEPQLGHQAAKAHRRKIIALDRPGIGRSDPHPGRCLLDWPMDVGAIADQLELGHFGVMGVSGGGPYALACAYAFPERLDFCVLMGSWAPVAAEPTLWTAMAPLDRFLAVFPSLPPGLSSYLSPSSAWQRNSSDRGALSVPWKPRYVMTIERCWRTMPWRPFLRRTFRKPSAMG